VATLESFKAINKPPLDSDYCFISNLLIEGPIIVENDKKMSARITRSPCLTISREMTLWPLNHPSLFQKSNSLAAEAEEILYEDFKTPVPVAGNTVLAVSVKYTHKNSLKSQYLSRVNI